MKKDAYISECGKYRYWLSRDWAPQGYVLPIIMLNPSTADADNDDPTIRRCIAFAKRERYNAIRVLNLFAFRATSPDDMMAASDPVGPEGSDILTEFLAQAARAKMPVLAAWGAHGGFQGRGQEVAAEAKERKVRLVCLGTTKTGHPRHPLYVHSDQQFIPFDYD